MSEGKPWIDSIMAVLCEELDAVGAEMDATIHNRIYEAVGRGDQRQGQQLVAAILRLVIEAQKVGRQTPMAPPDQDGDWG